MTRALSLAGRVALTLLLWLLAALFFALAILGRVLVRSSKTTREYE